MQVKLKKQALNDAERKKVIRLVASCIQILEVEETINVDWFKFLPIEYRSEVKKIVENAKNVKYHFLKNKNDESRDFTELLTETRIQLLEEVEKIKDEGMALSLLRTFNNNEVIVEDEFDEDLRKTIINKIKTQDEIIKRKFLTTCNSFIRRHKIY